MLSWAREVFSLNTKSLSLFRIFFGLFLAIWLGEQIVHLDWMFGANAIIKPSLVFEHFARVNSLRFHTLSDSHWYMICLFLCHSILIFLFIIGYKTKYIVVFLRIWTISLQMGNPLFRDGLDFIIASLFPWLLFLPLSEHYSRDSYHHKKEIKQVYSVATIGVTLWIFSVYTMIAYHRFDTIFTNPNWLLEVLHMHSFATKLGLWLTEYPKILQILSYGSLLLEGAAWMLYLIPWRKGFPRKLVVICMILFHLGIIMTLQIWMFGCAMMAIWLLFYPFHSSGNYIYQKNYLLIGIQLLLFCYVHCLQIQTILPLDYHIISPIAEKYARFLGIHVHWNLFSNSYTSDMRYVIEAKKDNGQSYHVLSGTPFSFQYPGYISENQRGLWQSSGAYPWLQQGILEYYCRRDASQGSLSLYKVMQQYHSGSYMPLNTELLLSKQCLSYR